MYHFSCLSSLEVHLNVMSENTAISVLTIVQCHCNVVSCLHTMFSSLKAYSHSLFNFSLEITKGILVLIGRISVCLSVLGN